MEDNKEKDYWIIWYPSYTHKDFELIDRDNDQPIIEDLTDSYFSNIHTYLKIETYLSEEKKESIRLFFYEVTRERNVIFRLKVWLFHKGILKDKPLMNPIKDIPEDKLVATIKLEYKSHSSNGLFVYKCVADENAKKYLSDNQLSLSEDKDQYPTFYCIKQLYHTHLFHKKSKHNNKQYKDYYFRAFLINEEPNVTETNNGSIKFYLRKILEYFELQLNHFEEIKTNTNADINSQKRRISEDIETLTDKIKDISEENDEDSKLLKELWENEINKRNRAKENLVVIYKEKKDKQNLFLIANDIVGETLFTNVLCCSKYLDKKDDEVRKLLLNIENVKAGLNYIRDCYRYWYDRQETKKSLRKSDFWGYLGYFVGILGIGFMV